MERAETIDRLKRRSPAILPSLLLCDFGNLEREVARLEAAAVPALHLDIMDGVFVPNFTYGMTIVRALRRLTSLPLDAHLMIADPGKYVGAFRESGADVITFHAEAVPDPLPILRQIRSVGAASGLAINPNTELSAIEPYLAWCDLVVVMSVPAGFGGQPFDKRALAKLERLRQLVGQEVLLQIDGGINRDTIRSAVDASADLLVVGSAIFGQADYGQAVCELQELLGLKAMH
ncbi:MAG TPA: ribulose-phosphate 3-epimerase [Pirellulaceae bacterium]|nr:ribulose-phosphate 3-epimerase [Pirellulaceae bacterium]